MAVSGVYAAMARAVMIATRVDAVPLATDAASG